MYAATIFLGAFLLFQVQPLIAKRILPWFGGTAAVWTTCMLFFQTVLVGGYLYAHYTSARLSSRAQSLLHLLLLGASLLALPILPDESWKPTGAENPTVRILALLALTVGPPYLLLSTTGPLVQSWFARARPGDSPYGLFSLSNAASLLALLSYPVLVEPWIGLRGQAWLWSAVYAAYALICGACAWRSRLLSWTAPQATADAPPAARPAWTLYAMWTALGACPSILLLAVTYYLTKDVAPIPFLWVLPLAAYLLSFILAFDMRRWYHRLWYLPPAAAALAAMAYEMGRDDGLRIPARIAIHTAGLFVCCMVCHGEAALARPHPRHLTGFYLMLSVGGALGGVFAALVAPYCFPLEIELPLGMVLFGLLLLAVHRSDRESPLYRLRGDWLWWSSAAAVMVLAVVLARQVQAAAGGYRVAMRNFYGGLKTYDEGAPGSREWARKLMHGAINHGEQWLLEERRREPTSYFGPGSGVARAIMQKDRQKPQRIGITGLGAGVMLSYARPGDYYRIYEINPLVVELARKEFTFLADCPARVDIVLGDARLSLEREPPQGFDVLHMDAFSGDSVPAHLLTREAFQLYFRHLKPDGILVIHISNLYLDLEPVVARAAEALRKSALLISDPGDEEEGFFGTDMVLLASDKRILEQPLFRDGRAARVRPEVSLWTDDYSNLFQIVK